VTRRLHHFATTAIVAGAILSAAAATHAALDPDLLAGMQARSIGPAGMSGRVTAVDAVVADPDVIWVGAATGGVWKSTSGGRDWKPVFDDQPVASIGAVSIFQPSPDIVWVGSGEGNPRNSVSVGNGIYRTLDGGESWQHLGLEETERIHRVILHPADPDVATVCALGREWGENEERGVFRTTDGGKSWRKILYVDEKTGCGDLKVDPSNPNKMLAAMWEFRRWPWFFRSGGPGSGIHLTVDGGATWKQLTPEDGLPEGDLGRVGLAFSASHPSIIYALIETQPEIAVYASKDGGQSWSKAGSHRDTGNRPFYFADLRVDPAWPDRLYSLWSLISLSDDGGKTFEILAPFSEAHPDHHAMWINPGDPEHIIAGNDGGIVISRDRGESWQFVSNLPLAQFYHIHIDMDLPYHIYGGLQDNGSWRGPSQVWETGGIRNHMWKMVGFGDGFDTRPHPEDSQIGYSMSQQGFLYRWNLRAGTRKDIRPPAPEGVRLRFNWNSALGQDPFEPDTIYYGSQFVHRSRDRGDTWEIISPDLTTNDPKWQKQAESGGLTLDVTGAENFTTILSTAPSPVERGLIWVGTDDGRLHLTRDGGASWQSVEERLKGVPKNTWIPHVEPSRHEPGTAFVVLDNHRRSDWTPYAYRTNDYGRTWKSLVTDDLRGYCLGLAQDPVDPDLLFLGTEFGLYLSIDGGRSWAKWTHGVPTVGVRDLIVHPREHDLVIGTHGRAVYVLDDIRPLREISQELLERPIHLFETAAAIQYASYGNFPINNEGYAGENRDYGALITFSLSVEGLPHPDEERERERNQAERAKKRAEKEAAEKDEDAKEERDAEAKDEDEGKATVLIYDSAGERLRTLKPEVKLGLNRLAWDLRRDPYKTPPLPTYSFFQPRGPRVLPGEYTIRVRYGDHEATGKVTVLPDPRHAIAAADRRAKYDVLVDAGEMQERVTLAIETIQETVADVGAVLGKTERREKDWKKDHPDAAAAGEESPWAELATEGKALQKKLRELEKKFWVPIDEKGIPDDQTPWAKIRYAQRSLGTTWDAPTPAQVAYLEEARKALEDASAEVDDVFAEVDALRQKLEGHDIRFLDTEAM
jgi:photosystem II stability/assembly factor-like uncharacterized protein